jgi:hypothetical protein
MRSVRYWLFARDARIFHACCPYLKRPEPLPVLAVAGSVDCEVGTSDREKDMARHDEKATGAGSEYARSPVEGAMSVINTASQNMQVIASEMLEISKQSFEYMTQTLEKLRHARGVDEVVAIQTAFVKEAFEHAAQHARKFSELMTAFPVQITKTYQDAWLKSVNDTVEASETASCTAAENSDRLADAARKPSNVFDGRESA